MQLTCVRIAPPPPHSVPARDEGSTRDEAGCDALKEVLTKRIDTARLFTPDALTQITVSSGGHLRNLLTVAAEVLKAGSIDSNGTFQLPIPLKRAKSAISEYAITKRQVARFHAATLEAVAHHKDWSRLSPTLLDGLLVALDLELVLIYRNGDIWYDVHPLVQSTLDNLPVGG